MGKNTMIFISKKTRNTLRTLMLKDQTYDSIILILIAAAEMKVSGHFSEITGRPLKTRNQLVS